MSRVTIYLEPDLAKKMRAAAQAAGLSQSRWVAELIRRRLEVRWPEDVGQLAGAWARFPEAEALRALPDRNASRAT